LDWRRAGSVDSLRAGKFKFMPQRTHRAWSGAMFAPQFGQILSSVAIFHSF
jgi:hypothetical protein